MQAMSSPTLQRSIIASQKLSGRPACLVKVEWREHSNLAVELAIYPAEPHQDLQR